ncbi:sulfotransferase family protein [Nocardioides sp.]|uniref:sulfotransferase family protein n=1 Tax=Nocardioides sp. TaxID=35761 RepID=UPI002C921814|nr:sulfotransferase family protein [Nocardioides sp.]HSX66361.1 sulfotransferase family protein [Nocardioides sp.]
MAPAQNRPSIVLVTGSGRSGTSSLGGSLKRLGLHVPQPEVEADEKNPKGYYEPVWVIDFHKRQLKELALHNIDSRPAAVDLVASSLADGVAEAELTAWLREQVALGLSQYVIKDPHALWFADIWKSAAAAVGADLKLLTSLRHPAEVVGSRDLAYLQNQPLELRRAKETSNVAGWVHAALLTEASGRGIDRAFIRYGDLMEDWRSALLLAGQQLGLDFDPAPVEGQPHDNDDFLDAGLRKSRLTWDDVVVPDALRDMAEEVWQLLAVLVANPSDSAAQQRLDEIHADYKEMYAAAVAITFDHTKAEVTHVKRDLWPRIEFQRERADAAERSLTNRVIRRLRRR